MSRKRHYLKMWRAATIVTALLLGVLGSTTSAALAATDASLSLSPSTKTVATGSDVVVSVTLNPSGNSINTIQSVLSYPAANFSFVSIAPGSGFSLLDTPATGSVSFTSYTTNPVSTSGTVARITLYANSAGTASVSLASICPSGNHSSICSAAYTSNGNNNSLGTIGSPASYSVNGAAATAGNTSLVISNVTVDSTTASTATISWKTNVAATSVVNYGLNTQYGLAAQSSALVTNHHLTINSPGLVPATTYYFRTISATASGSSVTSNSQQFTTEGYNVTVTVHDANNKPIKGAVVKLDNQSATTSSAGAASFQNVPAGTQPVTITSGSIVTTKSVAVAKPSSTNNAYSPLQQFSLTASRGASSKNPAPYIVVVVIVLLIAFYLLVIPKAKSRATPKNNASA